MLAMLDRTNKMNAERARPPGESRIGDYLIHMDKANQLGKGSYAYVWRCTNLVEKKQVACKVIDLKRSEETEQAYLSETKAFERLIHPTRRVGNYSEALVKCFGGTRTKSPTSDLGIFFFELLSTTTLEHEIKSRRANFAQFETYEVLYIAAQVVSAVTVLHRNGIAHMDIKAENIAYDAATGKVTLFDLGFAYVSAIPVNAADTKTCFISTATVGTPIYADPEVMKRRPYEPFSADIWQIGQLLYHLICLDAMFAYAKNMEHLLHEMLVKCPSPIVAAVAKNDSYRKLIEATLNYKSPEDRATIVGLGKLVDACIAAEEAKELELEAAAAAGDYMSLT
jgi:serine/threonine protein kinase